MVHSTIRKVVSAARREGRQIKEETLLRAVAMLAQLDAMASGSGERRQARAQQGIVGAVITAVVVGVVGIVGLLIFSEVNQTIELPSGSNLSSTQTNLTDGFGSAMDLLPIVLVVLIASLVISVISRFR
jgi:hypothetical protein